MDNNTNPEANNNKSPKKRRRLSDLPALSENTKDKMAEKINYFKTLPNQILENVKDLEAPLRVSKDKHTTYQNLKSSVIKGRISIVNISDEVDPEHFKK
ncbi:MAG: hypothetical protein MK033_06340 [Candidatus Caenarcaniphilales bacterium]|nr:hypothetical protein [Candidatus Caenarcaniphilales bacterium]